MAGASRSIPSAAPYRPGCAAVLDSGAVNERLAVALRLHHGIVTARDLRAAGVTRGVVAAALRSGRIRSLRSGIYVAQDADLSSLRGRRRLALTVGGPDAVLSHRTAAAVWGLAREATGDPVHISVPLRCARRDVPGVVIHRSADRDATRHDEWPVSDVRRLLRELALTEPADGFRFPALAAVQRGLITPDVLADPAGVPQRALRIWAEVGAEARAGAVSGGEAHYWRLIKDSGLPVPLLNAPIPGLPYRADALWPAFRLITEIDGWEVHGTRSAFDNDRRRQNDLHLAGYVVLRFPVSDVMSYPERVLLTTEDGLRARSRDLGVSFRRRKVHSRQ